MPTKILSIITVNKNNALGLEKTIQSVIEQTSSNFEYIVIDGASNDISVAVIKKYTDKIDYWISEPDTGIYNAMNKGICKAQANYCLFLNSGDCLLSPETLANVFKEIGENNADVFYSDATFPNGTTKSYDDTLTINYLLFNHINHQNSIIKRSLFLNHSLYNENLLITSDHEFFLNELWKYKSKFYKIKTNISIYDLNGISSNDSKLFNTEILIVYKNIFNELADIINEYRNFHKTIYYDVVQNNYDSKFLMCLVKIHRKALKLKRKILSSLVY